MKRSKHPSLSLAPARVRRAVPTATTPVRITTSPASAEAPTEYRPLVSQQMPRFAGVPTFLRLPLFEGVPESDAATDVLLVGAPIDSGTSYRPGARLAPRAIREASSLARSFSPSLGVDIYRELSAADGGDVALTPHDLDLALAAITEHAEAVARCGVIGGYVGGDQTVTLAVLRGIQRAKLSRVTLVHFDAHPNTSGAAWGRGAHHGSVVRNAVEEGLIVPAQTLQIGVRGPYSASTDLDFALAHGFELLSVDEVRTDLHSVVSQVRQVAERGPVYVSVDVAVLDPAYAPGTGIPCPGGLTTWELQQLLRALVGSKIVGFDVVEVAPPYDVGGATALVGVAVLQEILSTIADTRRSATSPTSPRRRDERRFSP